MKVQLNACLFNVRMFTCAFVTCWLFLVTTYAYGDEGKDNGLDGAIVIKSQEAVTEVPIVPVAAKVAWAKNPVKVDGDMSDWIKNDIKPIMIEGKEYASWSLGSYRDKEDLSAKLYLCRDEQNLYIAVEVADDRQPAPERIEIAFAPNDSKLIVGWRDVGCRYGGDDVHAIFVLGKDNPQGWLFAHIQERMDSNVVNNSFGTETERLAFIERRLDNDANSKVFSTCSRHADGGKTVTFFEAAFPWKSLTPYVPVSYQPLKFNIAIHDKDEGDGQSIGAIGWTPGLLGTYSAAHFATLEFELPEGRKDVEAYAQIPSSRFVNQDIEVKFSFYNHSGAAQNGSLELNAKPVSGAALLFDKVALPVGFSQKILKIHSEKVGSKKCGFQGRLTISDGKILDISVHAPTIDDTISIQPVAEVLEKIAGLEKNVAALSELYERVKAQGLDTAYPLAYLTLQQFFIPRCRLDLKVGDSDRVLKNTAYLEKLNAESKAYMEAILKDPKSQLKVPPRFAPDKLTMKDGYYFDNGKPVFLWGPCTFWYLKQDQPFVGGLGFNSVCPELPQDSSNKEAVEHMENWYRMGISVNASITAPDLQLTGRDARASKLLKAHPDLANLDANNFLPFMVQHPVVREGIVEGYSKSVGFWRNFPGVRSYWLWNEPWYLNYSEGTRKDFIEQYLKPRYKTVEALNKRWKSSYASFDDVKLITWPDPTNYAPWYDFQQFRDILLADFFSFLSKSAKGVDSSKPTHTKFMSASLHSFSIEKFQAGYNIAGHDGSNSDRDIVFLDFCKSIYPDHPLVNTEIHIFYGGKTAVEMVAWRLALHGLADGNWWCWHSNPRFSDSLGNVESMYALTISGLDVQRLFYPYIYALNIKPRPVATLFPDVVERRSDIKMVRIRHEIATAQYMLGVQPFYATETRISAGELSKHKLLLAGESDYVKDSTYKAVVDYVKDGGKAIVLKGGFAHNEYGDPRDASELVKPNEGKPFCEGATMYPLGKGQVICINSIQVLPDVVTDGGQCLAEGASPEKIMRRTVYRKVLGKAMEQNGLEEPIRIVAKDSATESADTMFGLDWRCTEVDGTYVLAVLPYHKDSFSDVKMVADRPIKKIFNLITEKEIAPDTFKIETGPNMFRIELAPDPKGK